MKNEKGTLPLNKNKLKKIALIGPNAKTVEDLKPIIPKHPSHPVTILDEYPEAVGNVCEVLYAPGCRLVKKDNSFDVRSIHLAGRYCNFVGGLDATIEGEEKPKESILTAFTKVTERKSMLPEVQLDMIKAMIDT